MIIVPLLDQVLIRPDPPVTAGKFGLAIPERPGEKPQTGVVLAAGSGRRLESGALVTPVVRPGDRVMMPEYKGHHLTVDGEKLVFFREELLLAILEKS